MSDPAKHLCELAQSGDPDAAEELITLHYERLYGWLRRLTGHDEDAADLTQKTFSRVWKSLSRFQGKSSFSTWLHAIGHHVYLDWRRGNRPADPLAEEWWATCIAHHPSPSESASDRDMSTHLFALVETLAEDIRQTVHLHYYEGLSLAETAETLGVATSTVKYRLRQAIDRLRHDLRENQPSAHL